MLELAARRDTGTPVPAQLIAQQRAIPEKYLTHILLQLKRSNLVHSMRGAQGGYMLALPPNKISLLQIIESIDGPLLTPVRQETAEYHEMDPVWERLAQEIGALLAAYTLDKMLETTAKDNMFHI